MTTWSLVLSSFRFYARSHFGTLLGVAVGAMVLVGAMLVGESVRGSLRDMAAARLGKAQLALPSGDRLFRAALAKRLADELHTATAATLQLPGLAKRPSGEARANNVVVMGVDAGFWKLALEPPGFADIPDDAVVLNERLARQLGVAKGDVINLRVHNPSQLSRDAPMAPIEDATATMAQLNVHAVVTDRQFGRFSLQASQIPPHTAFVSLGQLQSEIDKPGMANLMLVADATTDDAQTALAKHWQLADAQAQLIELPNGNGIELRTPRIFLESPLAKAARAVDPEAKPVLTYFVNKLQLGDKATPYSMVAALDGFAPGKIWLNQWTADDLQTKVGDEVELAYYTVGTMRQLEERTAKFTVGGVIAMDDPRADRTLMPQFPGMTDSENCSDWDTGFPMDLDAIRDKDEDYWDEYKGTPKAFISLADGQEIWSNRFGDLTAVRFAATDKAALGRALLAELTPADTGLTFRDIRAQADESVSNSMDFGGLFMGFSFFLIASAVMLISLLFQFTMEKRTRETGTLLALGIPAKRVRRMLLLEGGLIALAGCAIGGIAGAAYARAMLNGLATNWKDAVASAALTYHGSGTAWAIGLLSAFVIAVGTIWWSLRKLNTQTARELLSGESAENTHTHKSAKRATVIGSLLALGAAAVVAGALAGGTELTPSSFYAAGAMLLLAGLAFASARLTRLAKAGALGQADGLSLTGLGQRNAARRRRRSMATIGMLACGSFMIASIGVFQKDATIDANDPTSGTGGFALMGEASIAVVHDMNDPQQRADHYNLDEGLLAGVGFVPFRLRDGDHANCLNLNRAQQPRLLGGKPEQLKGRFTFAATLDGLEPGDNPWALLETARATLNLGDEIVPAVADQSVMMWALGMKMLGDTIDYTDEHGNAFKVMFVGQLADSILQGNLLIAESDFIKRFPSESGYRVFLVDGPADQTKAISDELNIAMENHGFEWVSATQRLGELNAVQNTYLNTFQVLGGLGLLLGSLGLGVVVMRNVQERKSELALLRAIGFEKKTIKRLVLAEYLGLLIGGLLIGAVSAGLAVLPTVLSPTADVPYALLGATLGGVLLLAGMWTWLATNLSLRGNLLEGFRGD
ncbi:MAG: ABC-type lipoprotein release transport system permease subunit [Limisphaerales bacterium]|jgi:ABC-type lipoprotein release transport system permease subunit